MLTLGLAGLAAAWCYLCGRRGFFAFDQSIIFDGGYRVLAGQMPYRDFFIPFGPVVFWIQALFFRLLGVSYFAFLAHAATVNAVVTLSVVAIMRKLYPQDNSYRWAAGIITAVWFYAPFGTPWAEQTAFACAILGLACLLYGLPLMQERVPGMVLLFVAGILMALSGAAKQNAAIFFLPLPVILMTVCCRRNKRDYRHALTAWGLGMTATGLILAVWLWTCSDPQGFWRQFLIIPGELGRQRILGVGDLINKLFFNVPAAALIRRLVLAGGAALAALIAALRLLRRGHASANGGMALLIAVYALIYQQVYYISSYNAYFNAQPLLGLIFGIMAAELCGPLPQHFFSSRKPTQTIKWVMTGLLALMLTGLGMRVGYTRRVQDIFEGASFERNPNIPQLRALRWGDPTVIRENDIRVEDIEKLYGFLRARDERFFIFPDFTVFYGLLDQPAPQPFLWFHKGLTYPTVYDQQLDERLVSALHDNDVRLIIIERESFFGTPNRLADFPLLKNYMHDNFRIIARIGIFDVFEYTCSGFEPPAYPEVEQSTLQGLP